MGAVTAQNGSARPGARPTASARPQAVIACHDCGKIHRLPTDDDRHDFVCTRCAGELGSLSGDLDWPTALLVAAAMMFVIANAMPFMTLSIEGFAQSTTLLSASLALFRSDMPILSGLVLFIGTVAPACKIGGLLYVLISLRLGRQWPLTSTIYRLVGGVRPWAMMEVYLLGMIVAYAKLRDLAQVDLDVAVYAFVATVLLEIAAEATMEPMSVWHRLMPQAGPAMLKASADSHPMSCHACQQVVRVPATTVRIACPRCRALVRADDPARRQVSLALVVAAVILYVPANVLPIMTVIYFGSGQPSTIMGGVIELWHSGMYPISALVFAASIVVPVLKVLALSWLIFAKNRDAVVARAKTRVYRIVELVGRWSMVDVFMIGILTALVNLGNVATVIPGAGALAFASVVVLTMLASSAFDPHSIWRRD